MKKNSIYMFLIAVFSLSCSSPRITKPPEFPLERGTTWIYSYETYEPSASDPSQIVKAVYHLTTTVVRTEVSSSYFIAHMAYDYELVNSDNGWRGLFVAGLPNEEWFVANGQQIFATISLDEKNINEDQMRLEYVFPLAVDKRWCQLRNPPCQYVGWRVVTSQSSYETPAGKFDDCYDMRDIYNGGGLFQKFCVGVGVVTMKYDHVGTSFGYEQTLIDYSLGAP